MTFCKHNALFHHLIAQSHRASYLMHLLGDKECQQKLCDFQQSFPIFYLFSYHRRVIDRWLTGHQVFYPGFFCLGKSAFCWRFPIMNLKIGDWSATGRRLVVWWWVTSGWLIFDRFELLLAGSRCIFLSPTDYWR